MEQFDKRALEFLHESNAIEDITSIDYTLPANHQPGQGPAGAFSDSQERARKRQPLEVEDLCTWQSMLCEEQLQFGVEMPRQGVGKLRSMAVPYQVRVGEHIAPSFDEVPASVCSRWMVSSWSARHTMAPRTHMEKIASSSSSGTS